MPTRSSSCRRRSTSFATRRRRWRGTIVDPRIRLTTRVARYVTLAKKRHRVALALSIEDNGPGIPGCDPRPDLLSARLGARRRQRARAHAGAGVHRAARRRHRVRSAPGRTVFTILLPLDPARRARAMSMTVTCAAHMNPRGRRDETRLDRRRRPLDSLGAREGARARGHRVQVVRLRPTRRCRRSRAGEPSVLVSDIRMPGESGLALLDKVKERDPQLPVIIMTAYSDLDSAVAAFQGGAFEYLPKPFDVDHARGADPARDGRGAGADAGRGRDGAASAGDPRSGAGDAGGVPRDRPAVAVERDGADHRRIGHRQGAGRAGAAPAQSARRRAVHRDQHGGDPEGPAGVRAVRPRARRVHGRAERAPRPLRAGRGRHAVPGRDRRHAAGPAGAAAARARRRRVLPGRRPRAAEVERSRDRRHAPESRGARAAGAVPRGSAPPAERRAAAAAAAARAAGGHRAARPALPAEERARSRRGAQALPTRR